MKLAPHNAFHLQYNRYNSMKAFAVLNNPRPIHPCINRLIQEQPLSGASGVSPENKTYRKTQERLRRSQALLKAVQQLARIGAWEWDVDKQSMYWTDQVHRIHEFQPGELSPEKEKAVQLAFTCFDEKDRPTLRNAFQQCLAQGRPYDLELPFTTLKGRRIWVRTRAEAVIRDGRIVRVIGQIMDVTNHKKMQTRLQRARKMESIGDLAGGVAHDFNNILFPILGMSEMLLDRLPKDSPEYNYAQQIFSAGKRGHELVKQILSFGRQHQNNKIPVQIQHILNDALKLSRTTSPAHIEITQRIQDDCGMVMADPTQLHRVAMNLIKNAIHAVEPGPGQITINLKQTELVKEDLANIPLDPGCYAVLSVSDTGCGIDPNVVDQIFDPYFTTKRNGKGTGLGLAVVYGIIKKHNGDIKVYSEPGKGACFIIYLPIFMQSLDAASASTVSNCATGVERILLVDDEAAVVEIAKLMLERLGYKVTARYSSMDALEAFQAEPDAFDLVITDMNMPNMTGDQLARELTAIRENLPVILCTGFSEQISREQASAAGVKGRLMKPIAKLEMARVVREVLDGT